MKCLFRKDSRKPGRIGVLACTATCDVYGWRPGSRLRTGGDAYSPSKASNPQYSTIPIFHHSIEVIGKSILFAITLFMVAPISASTYELSRGDVKITLESTPDKVVPSADLMLTVTIDSPTYLKVVLPDLRTRFSGFSLADDFASDPVEAGGRKRQTYRWRLVPEPAAPKYRLAPFAVETLDQRVSPPRSQTFATKPVLFSEEGPRPSVTGDPEVTLKPDWIPPTAKTVALWILFVILGLIAFAALVYGLMQISRRVKEYKMSPIERAMAELHRLLNRNLPGKGLYKDFYIELTMVVRRYIERTHGIHAPEQTTQEFLIAAAKHPLFKREVLVQLRTFLESADLVKFAGQEATLAMADDATQKAKRYIEDDSHHADTPSSSKIPHVNG